jgi:hypothetical protein
MKKINGLIAGSLLLISNSSFASEFCLSENTQPTHCKAGDIILIGPRNVPLTCDFSKQIIQMSKKEKTPEYICTYTGKILKIKKGPVKAPPPRTNNPANYGPPPKQNKSMFGNMPFMNK